MQPRFVDAITLQEGGGQEAAAVGMEVEVQEEAMAGEVKRRSEEEEAVCKCKQ